MMTNAAIQKSAPILAPHGRAGGSLLAGLLRLPVTLLDVMIDWQQRSEERVTMINLSGQQLRDIGLSAEALKGMAGKARWGCRD